MDNQQNIQYQISVNTKDAENNVKTLDKQIRELRDAMQKASQLDNQIVNVDGVEKTIDQVIAMRNNLIAKVKSQDDQSIENLNKTLNKKNEMLQKAQDAETKAKETARQNEVKALQKAQAT